MENDLPVLKGRELGGSLNFFVIVKDVDKLRNELSREVEVVVELETKFYGMREFSIRDLNGYFLTFAQRME